MLFRQVHVIKVPTDREDLFPYSHYKDKGHNPMLSAELSENQIVLSCKDIFKLKPNVQQNKRTRVDIYMPVYAGFELGNDILVLVGAGHIAELAAIDPENFRSGPQTLPLIDEARKVSHRHTEMHIAGSHIYGGPGSVYIDRERPNDGHIEMQGSEIHLGIPLTYARGIIDLSQTRTVMVPENEIRVQGESNPIRKCSATLRAVFDIKEAQNLAATLIYYGQK